MTIEPTTMPDPTRYAQRVMWSDEDGEFVATCVEFPSLSSLAPTRSAALDGLDSLVEAVLRDLVANDEPVPEPLGRRRYSGRFNLRIGEALHRELAVEASESGMSLNQYVAQCLAGRAGGAART